MKTLKIPFALTLIAVLFGTGLGAFFGIQEKSIKNYLKAGIQQNVAIQALSEAEKSAAAEKLTKKSWRYVQRAHFHGAGIAAITLGLLFLLSQLALSPGIKGLWGYVLALSGLTYPFFWLLAGLKAPEMGAAAAKESYEWIAYAGGLYVLASLLLLPVLILKGFQKDTLSL